MAKVKFSALISEMRGKLNGSVFSKNRSGNILRNKVTPINPSTSDQARARTLFTNFSQKWQTLDPAAQKAWHSSSQDYKRNNIFGDAFTPTGSNLYCELNANMALIGGTELTHPPLHLPIAGITSFTTAIDSSAGTFTIDFDPTPTASDVVHLVFATRCYSPGRTYVKNEYRIIGTIDAASATPFDAFDIWSAKFGDLIQGQMISVRLVAVHKKTGVKFKPGNDLAGKVL